MVRRYESSVRDERANQTRLALLEAYEALLLEESSDEEVTIPAVARRAGVTKPTAYSYFPDQESLISALLERIRERIGMTHDVLVTIPPAKLPAAAKENYRRFEESSPILRRLMGSPAYERVRLSRKVDRAGLALPTWGEAKLEEGALRERLGAVYLLTSPASWRWLRDTWGLSPEGASRAAAWAVAALIESIPIHAKHEDKDHEDSSRHDSGQRSRARRPRSR